MLLMAKVNLHQRFESADFSTELDRFEAKYIIPRQLVEPIKQFIQPYCEMDKHCEKAGGQYVTS